MNKFTIIEYRPVFIYSSSCWLTGIPTYIWLLIFIRTQIVVILFTGIMYNIICYMAFV